jgi:hypothetical protein
MKADKQKLVELWLIVNLQYSYTVSVWSERQKAIEESERLMREGEYDYELRKVYLDVMNGAVE